MDMLKGGWHPAGDKQISRKTWKSDLKNIATGKNEQADRARDHVSTPLSTLKDPESFGPPPKHTAFYPDAQTPTSATSSTRSPAGGLGAPVPAPAPRNNARQVQEQEEAVPAGPYRVNTTGLRTDNLPAPPVRRGTPVETAAPAASRPVPSLPPRTAAARTPGPPPILPPRQSENPSEHAPPPPPTYGEAIQAKQQMPHINQAATSRLAHAGVSVPALGIGSGTAASPTSQAASGQGHAGQLSELQQRFARMSAKPSSEDIGRAQQAASALPSAAPQINALAAGKKKPPPPPAKKAGLSTADHDESTPPPIPMMSKPRPG